MTIQPRVLSTTPYGPPWLHGQARALLSFFAPRAVRPGGGFHTAFTDDGAVVAPEAENLVQTCRYTHNFALAHRRGWLASPDLATRGLDRLWTAFRDPRHGGYVWTLDAGMPADQRKLAYGHAFVLLAAATASDAGLPAQDLLADVAEVLETRFWEPGASLYSDEQSADWRQVDPYRGQNANMHLVEAYLAAFHATRERAFLDRANALAEQVIGSLMGRSGGLLWEHYLTDWTPDFDYNRLTPHDLYRPYGVLPGHLLEWAKLLLLLDQAAPSAWARGQAHHLFAAATTGWDTADQGFFYALDRDGSVVDDAKYQWVIAEAIGASAILAATTGEASFADWYARSWAYARTRLIDNEHGGWVAALTRTGERLELPYTRGKSDFYHPLAAIDLALTLAGDPLASPAPDRAS